MFRERSSSWNCSRADVVADERVVEVGVPVDLERAGDVSGVVEQHVLVALDDANVRIVEVFGQPRGAHERVGEGIALRAIGRIGCMSAVVMMSPAYPMRVPFATGCSSESRTTSVGVGIPPRTRTSLVNPAMRRGPRFTAATICRPRSCSGRVVHRELRARLLHARVRRRSRS